MKHNTKPDRRVTAFLDQILSGRVVEDLASATHDARARGAAKLLEVGQTPGFQHFAAIASLSAASVLDQRETMRGQYLETLAHHITGQQDRDVVSGVLAFVVAHRPEIRPFADKVLARLNVPVIPADIELATEFLDKVAAAQLGEYLASDSQAALKSGAAALAAIGQQDKRFARHALIAIAIVVAVTDGVQRVREESLGNLGYLIKDQSDQTVAVGIIDIIARHRPEVGLFAREARRALGIERRSRAGQNNPGLNNG